MSEKIAVIGGGAAGLMAAVAASDAGHSVTVFEKMPRPARKILVTGKGRCNLTNNTDLCGFISNVCRNPSFLYSAFSAFSSEDTMFFFEKAGVPLKTERGNRVFPVSDRAMDIADALVNAAKLRGAKIHHNIIKKIITLDNHATGVEDDNGNVFEFNKIILATGGKSYPTTGSTGDGYVMAKALGHTVTPARPSLTGLDVYEDCSHLSGLSLKNVRLTVTEKDNNKPCFCEQGEMLFTHTGISGPLVLSASAAITSNDASGAMAYIDLKPALSNEQLDKRILRDFSGNLNKDISNSLSALLPSSIIPSVIKLSHIPPATKINSITKKQREMLRETLKAFTLHITGFGPIEQAIITRGGVSTSEIDSKTMKSKLINGLSFAGEVIDIDAFTGGFNLQIAFSTGYSAGTNI